MLREPLATSLCSLGWDVVPGIANFVLRHLPPTGPSAATVVARCRHHGLFIRDATSMSPRLGPHTLRIVVKDAATQPRATAILRSVLESTSPLSNYA